MSISLAKMRVYADKAGGMVLWCLECLDAGRNAQFHAWDYRAEVNDIINKGARHWQERHEPPVTEDEE